MVMASLAHDASLTHTAQSRPPHPLNQLSPSPTQALAYLGAHVTEDTGLNTRLLGILQPQVARTSPAWIELHMSPPGAPTLVPSQAFAYQPANINAASPSQPIPLPPSTVPIAAARTVLRTFVATAVTDLVPEAPSLAADGEALLGRLLNLFLSTQLTEPKRAAAGNDAFTYATLTWRQLSALCFCAAVWALECGCVAAALAAEPSSPGPSLAEVRALRARFWRLDARLSGCIRSTDLAPLLLSLTHDPSAAPAPASPVVGDGYYTAEDVRVALLELDPDGTGLVDFASFVRWWCAPAPLLVLPAR